MRTKAARRPSGHTAVSAPSACDGETAGFETNPASKRSLIAHVVIFAYSSDLPSSLQYTAPEFDASLLMLIHWLDAGFHHDTPSLSG